MPYCREALEGGGGRRKGRATYRTSKEVHSPGSWENRTAKEETKEVSNPGTCPLLEFSMLS